ncbi:MAG TPA: transcription/translation regulatory transformer protein RfaH [Thiothrix sp.]|nr:transcription/translation regulatory transformer protein RfaH [Thiothrix sp.]
MNIKDTKSWWLLMTKAHKEFYAEEQLNNQGYTTYSPQVKRLRKRKGKVIKNTEPLFPKYVFIQLDPTQDNWMPIRSTRGITNFVKFGGNMPAQVPTSIIETLMQEEKNFADKVFDMDRYKKGQVVTINNKAFKNIRGIFQCYEGEQRAMVLISLLQTETILDVSPAEICNA